MAKIETLQVIECRAIRYALYKTNGNKTETARLLGISRRTLYSKIKEHKLDVIESNSTTNDDGSNNLDSVCANYSSSNEIENFKI